MKDIDKLEAFAWLQEFVLLSEEQAGPIIHRVSQAEASDAQEDKFTAFSEAVEKLPTVLKSMKQFPKPKRKELRLIKKLQESGLDAYIKSCEWSIKLLEEPNRARLSAKMWQITLATKYWDLANEEIRRFAEKCKGK